MQFLNTFDRKTLTVASLVVAALFLFFVNILATLEVGNAQIDLTRNNLFTLSDGTKSIVSQIDEPITFRYYYSRKLGEVSPQYGTYSKRVRELLERYAEIAGGKIRLQVINPEPFSVEEDEAVRLGMQGIPLDQTGERGYFGLAATNSTDDRRTVGFFNPQREQFLEYDVTRIVYELVHPEKKKVGLMTSLTLQADPMQQYQPWPVVQQIQQFFEIVSVDSDAAKIPEEIDVLLIAHPRFSNDKTLYAIDQFVMRGGRAVILVDPHNETARMAPNRPPGAGSSNLKKLFDAWGIAYDDSKFVGDRNHAVRVSAPVRGRDVIADYLSWNQFDQRNINSEDVTTAQLNAITVASAGAISLTEDSSLEITPLLQTSPASGRLSTDLVQDQPDPQAILDEFKSEEQRFTIAARLSGMVKSAFPAGPPPEEEKKDGAKDAASPSEDEKAETPGPHVAEAQQPVNLIVVADSDFLNEQFWMREQNFFGQRVSVPLANNADFVINALDNLGGSGELIGLRSRGLSVQPFYKLQEIRNAAEERYRETEQKLSAKLEELQKKVANLEVDRQDGGGQAVLTTQQRRMLDQFRSEMLDVRQQLRDVQFALRKDIESLTNTVRILNIWAMPVLVAIVAIIVALVRRRKFRQRTLHG